VTSKQLSALFWVSLCLIHVGIFTLAKLTLFTKIQNFKEGEKGSWGELG